MEQIQHMLLEGLEVVRTLLLFLCGNWDAFSVDHADGLAATRTLFLRRDISTVLLLNFYFPNGNYLITSRTPCWGFSLLLVPDDVGIPSAAAYGE
jgi:hypothetical protein